MDPQQKQGLNHWNLSKNPSLDFSKYLHWFSEENFVAKTNSSRLAIVPSTYDQLNG